MTKRYQYCNVHPQGLEVDDCVKRAIVVTTGMDYAEVQRGLNQHKRVTGADKFYENGNPRSYVENVLGFGRTLIPKGADGARITVAEFCRQHPKGRFILSISGHWSAAINGCLLDTWDCGEEQLLSYYAITEYRMPRCRFLPGFLICDEGDGTASVRFYDGLGSCSKRTILAAYADGYRACLLDMGRREAIDWSDEQWQ